MPKLKILDDIGAALQFMQKGFSNFNNNASLFPSSPYLVDAMVAAVPLDGARCVIEFGPGTGVVTEAILKALPAGAHLHAIELDGALLETTKRRMKDPRLVAHHGSAADAERMIHSHGCKNESSAVFSSLGLSIMPSDVRDSILAAARKVLASDGAFVQYQYLHGRALTYQFGHGWSRFDGKAYLRRHFQTVKSRVVIPNMPPAAVYACIGPMKKPLSAPPKRARAKKPVAHDHGKKAAATAHKRKRP